MVLKNRGWRLKYRALLCDCTSQYSSGNFWGITAKRPTYVEFEFEFESLKYNAAAIFLVESESANASALLLVESEFDRNSSSTKR